MSKLEQRCFMQATRFFFLKPKIGIVQGFAVTLKSLTLLDSCYVVTWVSKVCSEKKFTHICMYYANSGRASVKSLRSAKSRHPEDSKLVRQVLIIQKILPENVIEQKKFFCENTIFVKKY